MKKFIPHTNPIKTWNVNVTEIYERLKKIYEKLYSLGNDYMIPKKLWRKLYKLDIIADELLNSIQKEWKEFIAYYDVEDILNCSVSGQYELKDDVLYSPVSEKDVAVDFGEISAYFTGNIIAKEQNDLIAPLNKKPFSCINITPPLVIFYTFEKEVEFNILKIDGNINVEVYYDNGIEYKKFCEGQAPFIAKKETVIAKGLKLVIKNEGIVYINNIELLEHFDKKGIITIENLDLNLGKKIFIEPHNSSVDEILYKVGENYLPALKENDGFYIYLENLTNNSSASLSDEIVYYDHLHTLYRLLRMDKEVDWIAGPTNSAWYEKIGYKKHYTINADVIEGRLSVVVENSEVIPETIIIKKDGAPLHPQILEVTDKNIEAQFNTNEIFSVSVEFDCFEYVNTYIFYVEVFPHESIKFFRKDPNYTITINDHEKAYYLDEKLIYRNKINIPILMKVEISGPNELEYIKDALEIMGRTPIARVQIPFKNISDGIDDQHIIKIYETDNIVYAVTEDFMKNYIPYSEDSTKEFIFHYDNQQNLSLKIKFNVLNGLKFFKIK